MEKLVGYPYEYCMFPNVNRLVNRRNGTVIGAWLDTFQAWLLPPLCLLCGEAGADSRDLCTACAADLPPNDRACPGCATPGLSRLRHSPGHRPGWMVRGMPVVP